MQTIVVLFIGILVFGYLFYQIYKIFSGKNRENSTCGTGCECSIDKKDNHK